MGCGKSKCAEDEKKDAAAAATDAEAGDAAAGGAEATEKIEQPQSEDPRVIVVFGATGAQGGSVVRAMKDDKRFLLKAVTRNPDSDKAKALAEQGVDVIKADLDDAESIKQALSGAYGAFLVTNYWEHKDSDREIQQGKNATDAAKECGVQHLVFSSGPTTKGTTDKQVALMDGKFAISNYIAEQGVPFTVIHLPFYYENLFTHFKPKKNENHEYVLDIPMGDKPMETICVSEAGECIHQIFAQSDEFKGQTLLLGSQRFTVEEYAAILSKAFDTKKFVAGNITPEDMSKLDIPGANDFAALFEYLQTTENAIDIELTRRLNPNIPTFEQWVDNNRELFDSALE
jgi:uncharacterized protein YbjT (DUF2867 family)